MRIALAINALLALGIVHLCFPQAQGYTRKFFHLSYHDRESGGYSLGVDDVFMVFYWLVVFTGLRAAVMSYILIPFAQWRGVRGRKGQVRFAEQAWLFLYAVAYFSLGMVGRLYLSHLMERRKRGKSPVC